MTISRIAVFDFDGTLFRSPERPAWWPHQGFWGRLETLSPPLVPEAPGPEWYVRGVIAAALEAQRTPDTLVALVTGRIPKFSDRVRAILSNEGISPDEYHFATGASTLPFKVGVLNDLMDRFPQATSVDMWEDRAEHIQTFYDAIYARGRFGVIHHVRSTPMEFNQLSA